MVPRHASPQTEGSALAGRAGANLDAAVGSLDDQTTVERADERPACAELEVVGHRPIVIVSVVASVAPLTIEAIDPHGSAISVRDEAER